MYTDIFATFLYSSLYIQDLVKQIYCSLKCSCCVVVTLIRITFTVFWQNHFTHPEVHSHIIVHSIFNLTLLHTTNLKIKYTKILGTLMQTDHTENL